MANPSITSLENMEQPQANAWIYASIQELIAAPAPPPTGTQDTNLTKIGGSSVDTGYGPVFAGTQRVVASLEDVQGFDMTNNSRRALNVYQIPTFRTYGTTKFRRATITNTATAVSATGGNLYAWNLINRANQITCIRFYDLAAASVIVGTTPTVFTVCLQVGQTTMMRGADLPINFVNAISVAAVRGDAENSVLVPSTLPIIELEYLTV